MLLTCDLQASGPPPNSFQIVSRTAQHEHPCPGHRIPNPSKPPSLHPTRQVSTQDWEEKPSWGSALFTPTSVKLVLSTAERILFPHIIRRLFSLVKRATGIYVKNLTPTLSSSAQRIYLFYKIRDKMNLVQFRSRKLFKNSFFFAIFPTNAGPCCDKADQTS